MTQMLIFQQRTLRPLLRIGKFLVGAKSSASARPFPDSESVFPMQPGSTPTEGENPMKKLLTLSFAVLFVVALCSLSFAQPTLAPEVDTDELVLEDGVQQDNCSCFGHAPFRPFFRGYHGHYYGNACFNPCPPPCPPPCPVVFQRPIATPQYDCAVDPCAYPAYGYRAPIRSFFSRVFAPRYYGNPYCY